MKPFIIFALALIISSVSLGASANPVSDAQNAQTNRLLIVDGSSHEVIYDDGRDDLYCVTRVHRWRDEDGYAHRRRTMRCR